MGNDDLSKCSEWLMASPEAEWRLSANQVHLWRAPLDLPMEQSQALERFLTSDERERADRLVVKRIRNNFITARAALRNLLSLYVCVPPSELRFRYTNHGKPILVYPKASVQFNVSHSNDLAVFALTENYSIGVDVEYLNRRSVVDRMKIAQRLFSSADFSLLKALPQCQQNNAFLECWTRKEAIVKAIGKGLDWPLNQFDVTIGPDEPPELLTTRWDPSEAKYWSLTSIHPGPDYVGTLALRGKNIRLACWEWVHDYVE